MGSSDKGSGVDFVRLLAIGANLNDVLRQIGGIEDDDLRNATLADVSRNLGSRGKAEDSLLFCRAINNPLQRADTLVEVAQNLRKGGHIEAATDVLRLAAQESKHLEDNRWNMPALLVQVSEEMYACGERREAIDILRRAVAYASPLPQPFQASKALAGCVRLLASWGEMAEARQVTTQIYSPEQRERVTEELRKFHT